MPNTAAVALIAERLPAGLLHPGDPDANQPAKLIPLPGLASTGMPADQAAHFANEAGLPDSDVPKLVAEAIVALLEGEGRLELVDHDELEQLRAEAATLEDAPSGTSVKVYCRCNRQKPLLELTIGRRMVITDGALLRGRLDDVCGCA